MKIIFSGGKTGGHIYPNLRLYERFKSEINNNMYYYVGLKDSLEEKICKENNISFEPIYIDERNILTKSFTVYKESRILTKRMDDIKPDVIITTGGFVSIPLLIYARKRKIKYYLIEENVISGITTKLFAKKAKRVFLTFELENMKKNMEVTFNPTVELSNYKLDHSKTNKFRILILGGSLGSKVINKMAIELSSKISKNEEIVLVSSRYYKEIKEYEKDNFKIIEYTNKMHDLINSSNIVISRAGSSTISEIIFYLKPLIIIPSEKTKANHQIKNAEFIVKNDSAVMIREKNIEVMSIYEIITNIKNDDSYRLKMKLSQMKLKKDKPASKILEYIKEDFKNV